MVGRSVARDLQSKNANMRTRSHIPTWEDIFPMLRVAFEYLGTRWLLAATLLRDKNELRREAQKAESKKQTIRFRPSLDAE